MRCGNASKSMWLFESEPREGRLLAQHRDLILVWKDLLAQRRDLGPLQIKTTTQQVKLLFLLQLMARHHLFTILNLQLPPPSTLPNYKLLKQHSMPTRNNLFCHLFLFGRWIYQYIRSIYLAKTCAALCPHNFICDVVSQMDIKSCWRLASTATTTASEGFYKQMMLLQMHRCILSVDLFKYYKGNFTEESFMGADRQYVQKSVEWGEMFSRCNLRLY